MEKLNRKVYYRPNPEIVEKMKSVYLNCPTAVRYVNSLKIPEEAINKHIDILYDFARDINYCQKCPGIDNCIKENRLLCTKIVYQDGYIERQLTPCSRLLDKMKIKNQFVVMDFEDALLNVSIKDINKTRAKADAMKKFVDYSKMGKFSWIYLTGEQNTGRSYMASVMAVSLAKDGIGPIAYLNTANRFRQLADLNFKNPELFQKTLNQYCSVPVLVLDDFGSEHKNDFERDAILFEIISKRSADRLFTIFTSDFNIDDIEILYSTTKAATLRAKQITKIIKSNVGKEINLGDLPLYQ